jgi:diguanylate cyclase (GGDEF)-like protein/hemerythrin-like metal-binding protein/PAS domain S-box-containing protein
VDTTVGTELALGSAGLGLSAVSQMLVSSHAIAFAVIRFGRIAFANPAFAALFGGGAELAGSDVEELFVLHSRLAARRLFGVHDAAPLAWTGRAIRADGSTFDLELNVAWDALGGDPVACAFARDVSIQCLSEAQLASLAYSDVLTGLPNRALLMDRLRDAVAEAHAHGNGVVVMMADLDGLKRINDGMGHAAGDALLRIMAQRFAGCVRGRDLVTRLGGDEFCILLPQFTNPFDAEDVATRLIWSARKPLIIDCKEVRAGVSVGIASFPEHGTTPDELLEAADAALYRAKREGRGRFAWAVGGAVDHVGLPVIVWSDAYELGIPEIDADHRQLAMEVNALADLLKRGADLSAVESALQRTIVVARAHFENEERMIAEHGLDGMAGHREQHACLLDDLRNFAVGCSTRSLSLTIRFLQEWLLRHIDTADRELAETLRARTGKQDAA